MALRFYNDHTSWSGKAWRVEIWDSTFAGEEYEFVVASGVDFDYRGSNADDICAPILGSACSFSMIIQDTTHEALITDMTAAKEGRFTVRVERDGEFYWAGVINSPEVAFEDQYYPYDFRITAVDGLALLKSYPYTQGNRRWDDKFEGQSKLVAIVSRCLKKLPHIATHFADVEKFIVTAINWYSDQDDVTPGATYDPFWYNYLDNRAFGQGLSTGTGKFMSCYDVLVSICTAFNARIALFDGYWLVEQIEHRSATIGSNANYSRYYDYDLTAPTANTLDAAQDIGQGTDLPKANGGTFSFSPPLRASRVTQTVNAMANLIGGATFNSADSPATYQVGSVYGNGNLSYVRVTGGIEWSLENIDLSPSATVYGFFNLRIELGGKYAKRDVIFGFGGTYSFSAVTWDAAASDIVVPIKLELAATGETWTGQGNIDLFFRADTDFTYGDLIITFDLASVEYYTFGTTATADPADYTLDWAVKDPYLVLLNSVKVALASVGSVYPKTVTYEVIGDTGNTEEKETKVIIGDRTGDVLNQWGGLLYFTDPEYVYTSQWGNRNGTRNRTIAQLLAQRIISGLYYPRKTYRGTVIGNTVAIQTPTEQSSEVYLLTSGRYNSEKDELTGEWQRLAYTAAEFVYTDAEYDSGSYESNGPGGGSASGGSGGNVDNGGSGSSGGGGNGVYGGDGTVADGTIASMSGDFTFSNSSATSGDAFTVVIDDGASSNTIKAEAGLGVLLSSTGDVIAIEGETALSDVVSPTTLGADANDYAGLDGANTGRLTASTAVNITGMTGGSAGRILCVHNAGSNPITLINASASSTAANRFDIGADYTIRADHSALLQYDAVDSRWRIVATYVLGRWEEGYTTSTATTASLTTTSPATNINAAIVPKGTGGVLAAVPEGTSAGGNARGNYAVDLQTQRTNASDVASGANSTIPGGRRCTASGAYSFATGFRATASGAGSVAFGGSGAFSTGATASGSNSFAMGYGATASGVNSFAFSPGAQATAQGAVSFSRAADKYQMFSTIPVSFLRWDTLVLGTASSELFLDGSLLVATIPANESWQFEISVYAITASVGNGTGTSNHQYFASYVGAIRNIAGTTSLLGTVDALMAAKSDASMADAAFAITADNTSDYLRIDFTPPSTAGSTSQYFAKACMKIFAF